MEEFSIKKIVSVILVVLVVLVAFFIFNKSVTSSDSIYIEKSTKTDEHFEMNGSFLSGLNRFSEGDFTYEIKEDKLFIKIKSSKVVGDGEIKVSIDDKAMKNITKAYIKGPEDKDLLLVYPLD